MKQVVLSVLFAMLSVGSPIFGQSIPGPEDSESADPGQTLQICTDLGTCGSPEIHWTPVAGATEYDLQKNGYTVCSNPGTSLACTKLIFTIPGTASDFRAVSLVGGAYRAGQTLRYTPDCTKWSNRPLGAQAVLTGLFNFPDDLSTPVSAATAQTEVYTTFAGLVAHDSYGLASITGPPVVDYHVMPHGLAYYCRTPPISPEVNWSNCDFLQMRIDSLAILEGLGYRTGDYKMVLQMYVHMSGGESGGQIGSDFFHADSFIHEWGHAEGLYHSGSWTCIPAADTGVSIEVPATGGCFASRYQSGPIPGAGEPMGVGTLPLSAFHRALLGWQTSTERIFAACGTNSYVVKALDGVVTPRELRIPLDAAHPGWFYSLEYRPDGVWVWLHEGYPIDNGFVWAFDVEMNLVNNLRPVTLTDSFNDPYRGITVTMLSSDATEATLSVTRTCP